LDFFEKVKGSDTNFCKEQVHIRQAEIFYKMGKMEDAIRLISVIESEAKDKEKHICYMIKGKCYEKLREFSQASIQYSKDLAHSSKIKMDEKAIANIKFRLGWSLVRSRGDVSQGMKFLE
jgi:tetratricopeptide (TPR) repeat protein